MTKLEALQVIRALRDAVDNETQKEALSIAVEALKANENSSCFGCKYEGRNEFEKPCCECKRIRTDWWVYEHDK